MFIGRKIVTIQSPHTQTGIQSINKFVMKIFKNLLKLAKLSNVNKLRKRCAPFWRSRAKNPGCMGRRDCPAIP
ncbi:MAG: hypothetical protein LBT33_11145, partial [Spirochaetia bacterium]|nr:hypothetical protein [Spirochaetia bacterium]